MDRAGIHCVVRNARSSCIRTHTKGFLIASWGYGWDADNGYYNEQVNKILNQLQKICDEEGPNEESVQHYLSEVKDKVIAIVRETCPREITSLC